MPPPTPIYIVDGSAYIYRAYHAIRPLANADGLPTHAVLGFTNTLLRVLKDKKPDRAAVAFDAKGPTFRHALFEDYKANRPAMPADLAVQLPYVKEVVAAHSILCLEQSGAEADDLIASAVRVLQAQGHRVIVVSGDKDLLQLVSASVSLWDPMQDKLMDPDAVRAKYGVGPERLPDLFALLGDTSDNIPGVPGVGPKTGAKLLGEHGSLDELYARLPELANRKLREKLEAFREQAALARSLVLLKDDLEVPARPEAYRLGTPDVPALRRLYSLLGFARLAKAELPAEALSTAGFQLVADEPSLEELAARAARAKLLTIDLETTSLDPVDAEIVGISLCIEAEAAYYVPIARRGSGAGQLPADLALRHLGPLLADPSLPKLGHNLKYDLAVLQARHIPVAGPLLDTMVASYLLDPTRSSHKLDDLSREILECRLTTFSEVTKGDVRPDAFAHVPLEDAMSYSCEDVRAAFLLWEIFAPKLRAEGLWELFSTVEMPLVPLLAEMENTGIRVDPAALTEMSKEFAAEAEVLGQKIYRLAGTSFNINSPRQLGEILFDRLQLPHGKKTKTGYSTDSKVLEQLALYHELPAAVIAFRNVTKLKSTYVDALAGQVHPRTGRVHTSFNQTVTATGRLSSSRPNLQNIPIRTREGQRIREAFVPEPGHLFVAGDYSQIDLRILAHYSKDKNLLASFLAAEDIHSRTALEIFRVLPGMVTPEMRRVAKTINFGIVYGMSAFGLASQLRIGRKEAQTFIDRYFDHYPGVRRFMEEIIAQARRDRFVTTLLGRRRGLPDISSPNKQAREFAERTAINTPIQGTAADIIKLAMINTCAALKQRGLRAKMLLQIHDELVFEVPAEELEDTASLIKNEMERVLRLDVPLVINLSTGRTLAEV